MSHQATFVQPEDELSLRRNPDFACNGWKRPLTENAHLEKVPAGLGEGGTAVLGTQERFRNNECDDGRKNEKGDSDEDEPIKSGVAPVCLVLSLRYIGFLSFAVCIWLQPMTYFNRFS